MVIASVFKNFFKKIIYFVFPAQCIICKNFIENDDGICFECLNKIDFISEPRCAYCGYPFEIMFPNQKTKSNYFVCPHCLKSKPKFNKCLSVVRYNDASKKIILPFKHADKTNYARIMGKMMASTISPYKDKFDYIIPVPIHLKRMLKRKYNQSALLANVIAKILKKPVLYNILIRNKFKESQGHLSIKERKLNVKNSFMVKNNSIIKGKNILIVDDVMTTGATLNECAKVLKHAGARKIFVATFARVVK